AGSSQKEPSRNFFFQAEDGIRDRTVTGVQTCALPISPRDADGAAPYDPHWERRHPHRAAWMALAGPATNYTLMIIAAILLRLGWHQGWLHQGSFAEHLIGAMFSLNLLLGTFNLLPVTPLDGSTAIMLFMSETRAQRYLDWLRGNSYGVLGLVAALFAFPYVYAPIDSFARQLLLWSHF